MAPDALSSSDARNHPVFDLCTGPLISKDGAGTPLAGLSTAASDGEFEEAKTCWTAATAASRFLATTDDNRRSSQTNPALTSASWRLLLHIVLDSVGAS